jgi:hypothetical protein
MNSWAGTTLDSRRSSSTARPDRRKLRSTNLRGAKEMVIDFICREDLVITTVKEFFEIFISSLKKDQVFHTELMSSHYKYIGLSMDFNTLTSVATLRIFLA